MARLGCCASLLRNAVLMCLVLPIPHRRLVCRRAGRVAARGDGLKNLALLVVERGARTAHALGLGVVNVDVRRVTVLDGRPDPRLDRRRLDFDVRRGGAEKG